MVVVETVELADKRRGNINQKSHDLLRVSLNDFEI